MEALKLQRPFLADTAQNLVEVTWQVQEIQNGKDGYQATLAAGDTIIYVATIIIPNMKGMRAQKIQ